MVVAGGRAAGTREPVATQASTAINFVAARAVHAARTRGFNPADVLAETRRVSPEALTQPLLTRSLEIWQAKAGRDGIYRLGRDGTLMDLIAAGLLGPRSLLVTAASDRPESWVVSFAGATLANLFPSHSLIARRFVDLPARGVTLASAQTIAAVLPEARVAAHRVLGYVPSHSDGRGPGRPIAYDRLLLPVADRRGRVNRFITTSQYVDGIRR